MSSHGSLLSLQYPKTRYSSEPGTTKCPVFPFLRTDANTQCLEIWEFFIHGTEIYWGRAFSGNSAIISYLKLPLYVLYVIFHLVLELSKCSKFHHIFPGMSGRWVAYCINTSPHYVEVGTPRPMGSLWRIHLLRKSQGIWWCGCRRFGDR